MKEEYKAYLVSVLIGVIAGTVVESFIYIMPIKFNLLVSIIPPISVLFHSLILSKKFPIAWKEIRARFYCIILLLIAYMYSFCSVAIVEEWVGIAEFLRSLLIPFIWIIFGAISIFEVIISFFGVVPIFGYRVIPSSFFIDFLYTNIIIITITIAAAYVATIGIENLSRRIISAFLLAISTWLIAISPILGGG